MNGMLLLKSMALLWLLGMGQARTLPAYVVEGDRVEAELRVHRDNLERFFVSLRETVARSAPEFLSDFQDPPPEPVVYGYGLLPRIVDEFPSDDSSPVSSFSYSWPITASYVDGEAVKLRQLEQRFERAAGALTPALVRVLIREYRTLVTNQRTIDGYVQYNRFWQRAIARDRPRFEQLTRLYELMISRAPAATARIQEILGMPEVPPFVQAERTRPDGFVLRVPVYTDIEDMKFLHSVEAAVESMWRVEDVEGDFRLDLSFRPVQVSELYRGATGPQSGDHVDIQVHASRFPQGGAVLTTGAEATHGFVGRYVALGPGDLTVRTLAHEFGHVLGFRDGYLRGYRDLGDQGFEILELTSSFDDIMSAPREGRVLAAHFKLILDAVD